MQPTINKDFTPEQQSRYKEQKRSRKDGDAIEMQCLKINNSYGRQITRITIWKAGLIERLRIAVTGKVYLSFTGKPLVWIDSIKPYHRNELIQNIQQPKRKEQPNKTLTDLGGLGDSAVKDVKSGKAGGGGNDTKSGTPSVSKDVDKIFEKFDEVFGEQKEGKSEPGILLKNKNEKSE